MDVEEARARQQGLREMAAGDGLDMRFDLTRGANTFDGHRLLQLAALHGLQDEMKERLMRAHHTEGDLISDHDTLARLATEAGLPDAAVRVALAGDRFAAEVREDERAAAALGISGVPCFVVERSLAVSGAQSPEVLGELLRRGWEARSAV